MELSAQMMTQRWDAARNEQRRVLVDLIARRERLIARYAEDVVSGTRHATEAQRRLATQRERLARDIADLVVFDTDDEAHDRSCGRSESA